MRPFARLSCHEEVEYVFVSLQVQSRCGSNENILRASKWSVCMCVLYVCFKGLSPSRCWIVDWILVFSEYTEKQQQQCETMWKLNCELTQDYYSLLEPDQLHLCHGLVWLGDNIKEELTHTVVSKRKAVQFLMTYDKMTKNHEHSKKQNYN